MKTAVLVLLSAAAVVLFLAPAAEAQARAVDAATLTLQFDNSLSTVTDDKRQAVINALATNVFLVPAGQVTYVSGLNQGGLVTRQSVAIFRAVGPTTNRRTVLANCQENTRSRLLGLRDSKAVDAVEEATDTWWPNDKVEIEEATCAQAT